MRVKCTTCGRGITRKEMKNASIDWSEPDKPKPVPPRRQTNREKAVECAITILERLQ